MSLATLGKMAAQALSGLEKEMEVLETLHPAVQATLARLDEQHPGLLRLLERAQGYAVFPSVGKAAAVLGAAFGKGEVFEKGKLIGYAGIIQLTLGVQLGGQTFTEIIAFENKQALNRFKQGKLVPAATASVALVKAGAAASAAYEKGIAVFAYSDGGMMLEAAVGGQKLIFRAAALGRLKKSQPQSRRRQSTRRSSTKKRPRAGK